MNTGYVYVKTKMNKKIITTIIVLLLLVNISLAITPKEKKSFNEFLDKVGDDRVKFEIFLAFSNDQGYDFSDEEIIKQKIESNARKFDILLFPYTGIKGIDTDSIDAKTISLMEEAGIIVELAGIREKIKLAEIGGFWPIFFVLITLLIVIVVLEFYRKEKVKKIKTKKRKKIIILK